MPGSEARAWWADVQHVRETIERRRADAARADASGDHQPAARFVRAPVDDFEQLTPARRFERAGHAGHGAADTDRRGRGRRSERGEHWAGVERRDPDRADRRVARHHDPARAERRDPGRADRRASPGEHQDLFHADHRDASRGERRGAGRPEARRSGRRDATRTAESRRPSAPGSAAPEPTDAGFDATDFDAIERTAAPSPPLAPLARRTVQITGRPMNAPRLVEVERRRPARRPVERVGPRPDRVALWAVLLGFFLILVAASSSRGATTAPSAPSATPIVAPAAPAGSTAPAAPPAR